MTIGNFDGVHRGHQALLGQVRRAADELGLSACVMTFEPHPREFFARQSRDASRAPRRIAALRDKLSALAECGIDRVIVEHFNARFANLSAREFVKNVLWDGCHVRWIMVGEDFRFGAKRMGDVEYLMSAGRELGFDVLALPAVQDQGERISSSLVRAALAQGDLVRAKELLGHAYYISAHVIHGKKLGRTLGFPTLNLPIPHRRPALSGIYVVRVHGISRTALPGVASIGVRPTVDDSGRVLLEVHLLDFARNVYGALVKVEFLKKLRDEEKYSDLPSLSAAIAEDTRAAREFFDLPCVSENFAASATDRMS